MINSPLAGRGYICQIGFVVKDAEETAKAYANLFNIPHPSPVWTDTVEATQMKVRGRLAVGRAKLAFLQMDNVQLEFIQPDDGESGWKEFLEHKGEGLHHFAVKVKDMKSTLRTLTELGYQELQTGEFSGGRYACLDSESRLKTILELLEEDDSPLPLLEEAIHPSTPPITAADNPLGTKRIVHLGFLVHHAEQIAAAYAELFGTKVSTFETVGYDLAKTTYLGRPALGRARICLVDMGPLQLEFIEPDGEQSVWRDDLDRLGEGFHHLAFDHVQDLTAKTQLLEQHRMLIVQSGVFSGGAYFYANAAETLKTRVEFLERW